MRLFTLALIVVLGWLQVTLWVGKNGVSDYYSVKKDIVTQEQVNGNLRTRNSEMYAEIDDLSQGLDAIEERARNELGMIKEGETFYRILSEDHQ
ncbi:MULTISPECIES: cell division protein FtsB [unclassified Vibrio]|uniref:Cell division protein FtsB n=1 Tax=Vibrio sp. HB236076 TaxID=3232307 RepID=A0AB39HEL9_9VIBR|nr:cell division protein FtsB [Vibrio sp. HB161653]MDP5253965.1 cell division protein FtsB [Vibrio sp. HB161653]